MTQFSDDEVWEITRTRLLDELNAATEERFGYGKGEPTSAAHAAAIERLRVAMQNYDDFRRTARLQGQVAMAFDPKHPGARPPSGHGIVTRDHDGSEV